MSEPQPTRVRGVILDRIGDFPGDRVFYVDRISEDRFVVVEACDEYFSTQLSADELRALGQELIAAADKRDVKVTSETK